MRAVVLLVLAAGCAAAARPAEIDVGRQDPTLVIPPLEAGAPVGEVVAGKVEVVEASPSPRDPRWVARRPRSRAQILSDAQSLEGRLAGARTARAELHRRLAEAYSELAFTAGGAEATRERERAIEHYSAIVRDHATYTPLDDVLYYLGLAQEMTGHYEDAARSYAEIVVRYPTSSWVPLCHFGFGEMVFVQAKTEPKKYGIARLAYEAALKFPPSKNPVYADALLRLGEIHLAQGDAAAARETFARLRREAPGHPALDHVPPGY